jgi:hypothetical protein
MSSLESSDEDAKNIEINFSNLKCFETIIYNKIKLIIVKQMKK